MSFMRQGRGPRRLSVVIPAGDVPALEETLVSVLEHRPDSCEVVVALGMPYDDPWNIAEEVRFVQAPVGASLVARINVGVAACTGDVIHVLAAGWRATNGWTDRALPHFDRDDVGAVVPLGVAADDRDRVLSAGIRRTAGGRSVAIVPRAGATAFQTASAPALEAGFWRADVLAQGGFSTACGDALAAADMSAAVAAAGFDVVTEPAARIVQGPSRRRPNAFTAGMNAEKLFWRSLACERLLPAAFAHAFEVLRHAMAVAPLGTLPMLAGRLATLVQVGACIPRTRQLKALMREAGGRRHAGDVAGRTLRLDQGHDAPAAAHVDSPARELKRSA